MGIIGYYSRFVLSFTTIAATLTDLTKGKKSNMVKWHDKAEEAFQELKMTLCQYPVLVTPDFSREFIVQTDAFSEGLGAVLSQEVNEEEEHRIVYLSRKLAAS